MIPTVDSVFFTSPEGTRSLGYVNVPLEGPGGLSPKSASIFINDNLGSTRAAARRQQGADELARRRGGALGVLGVQELVIGVERLDAAVARWRQLVSVPKQQSGNTLVFAVGPSLRFVEARVEGIQEAVVRVRSLATAEQFLASRGMLLKQDGQVLIAFPAAAGVRIRLVQ